MANNLKPLYDAMDGLPDERKATATIALYAVIPAAIVGILGGAFLTPQRARDWELFVPAVAGAVAATAVVIAAVYLTRWLFGFRAVTRVAAAMVGLLVGVSLGMWLATTFDLGWWPLLLGPAFALLNLWVRRFSHRPTTDEPKPPAWRRKTWG